MISLNAIVPGIFAKKKTSFFFLIIQIQTEQSANKINEKMDDNYSVDGAGMPEYHAK